MTYKIVLKGGLQFSGIHEEIEEWLKSVPDAHFDDSLGTSKSIINGRVFLNQIVFRHKEDLLACILRYSDYLYLQDKYSQLA